METVGAESEAAALRARIEAALRDPLEEQWDEVLDQWAEAAAEEREAVRTRVSEVRDRLLDELSPMASVESLHRALAFQYVEVKSRWMRLNIRSQEEAARNDRVDTELLYRAACLSLIVQALDPLLEDGYVEELTTVLVERLE